MDDKERQEEKRRRERDVGIAVRALEKSVEDNRIYLDYLPATQTAKAFTGIYASERARVEADNAALGRIIEKLKSGNV